MVQNQSWSPGSSLQAERESRRAARTPSPHARSLLAWTLNGWTKPHEWAKGRDFKNSQEWMNGSKKFQIRLFWPGTVKHTSFGRMLVLKELPQPLEWSFDEYASKSNGGKQLSWWDEADQPRPPIQEMSWRVTRFFGSGLFLSQSFTQCRVAGSGRRGSNGIRHGTLLQISTQGVWRCSKSKLKFSWQCLLHPIHSFICVAVHLANQWPAVAPLSATRSIWIGWDTTSWWYNSILLLSGICRSSFWMNCSLTQLLSRSCHKPEIFRGQIAPIAPNEPSFTLERSREQHGEKFMG